MSIKVYSAGLAGIDGYTVTVECSILNAQPSFDIVGLPDTMVKESRERVMAAYCSQGLEFPNGKIIVNLAPADLRKTGAVYDLPVFLALMAAFGKLSPDEESCFLGEISLSGEIRPVAGVLPMTAHAKKVGFKRMYVPMDNAAGAALIHGIDVIGAAHISEILEHIRGDAEIKPQPKTQFQAGRGIYLDFSQVRGQKNAKRALEVAAAGGHNILMIGPPGSGKSMLAKRLPSILPPITFEEAMESSKIYSVAGLLKRDTPYVSKRPFRSPHHTTSAITIAGGGKLPRPGEISLSHNGVLFLDELPEFKKDALEVLRQPMEDREITVSRVSGTFTYPASFMLVCALNPCPCGYLGHPSKKCKCSESTVERYIGRISGPLLDRIDINIDVPAVTYEQLTKAAGEESSQDIRRRVEAARIRQMQRYGGKKAECNALLSAEDTKKYCTMTPDAEKVIRMAFDRMALSARSYDRVLRIAKTIADLAGEDIINTAHISEAISYRTLDNKYHI